ncbi:class I SAM-dependent methyltransferase [Sinomicrobium weinanense]|uniref:class I SAM-dependent methyltransferase n=1 Tax=Sinomicrobium weinanense TaxID=2842200 RepID=UPI0031E862A0
MSLLLKKSPFEGVSMKEVANQVEVRKKALKKLPLWYNTPNIYYPSKLSMEQTSSEVTAKYKAGLTDGKKLIDLTGGFGVDSLFFAEKVDRVFHCETDPELSEIASYNYEIFGVKNITTIPGDGVDHLKRSGQQFDWIYADPSRRNDRKGKVFMLRDCLPDIPAHLDTLFSHSENILIKTSPILDITSGITELRDVKEVHVVAVKNEVKELLWVLKKGYRGDILLRAVNLEKGTEQTFRFYREEENRATPGHILPLKYLYEPNAAILKAGGFKSLAEKTGLGKLHPHSHLYTSEELLENFPGRAFRITAVYPYTKKVLKPVLNKGKANITIRNFPESVAQVRKKFSVQDGGDRYLFFTTDRNDEKIVIACDKNILI